MILKVFLNSVDEKSESENIFLGLEVIKKELEVIILELEVENSECFSLIQKALI